MLAMIAAFVMVSTAHAALHQVNDPVFGPGSVTLDDVTQLEWLDVSASTNISYNTIVTQFGSGGAFQGWRHATLAEANALATRAGITINIGSTVANYGPASVVLGLIGTTAGTQALGFVAEPGSGPGFRIVYSVATQSGVTGSAAQAFEEYDSVADPALGHYLVRAAPANINTYAGNGSAGFSGDGGAAISASLNYRAGVVVDAAGNLYIADRFNQRIRKVDVSGVISTVAGNGSAGFSGDGGAATSASLSSPHGVAVDAGGNLYIADFSNNRIRKVDLSGVISTVAGNGSPVFSGDGGAATSAGLR